MHQHKCTWSSQSDSPLSLLLSYRAAAAAELAATECGGCGGAGRGGKPGRLVCRTPMDPNCAQHHSQESATYENWFITQRCS